jgi:CRP-like cAMP-binding protein
MSVQLKAGGAIAPATGGIKSAQRVDPNIEALRRVPVFSVLEDEALARLASTCRRRRYEAAELPIFHEGDDPGSLYVILRGRVHIRTVTPAGKSIHVAERGPGDQIGELGLIDGAPRMADAVTASPAELLILGREAFLRCLEEQPKIAFAIMRSLSERLREAARRLALQEEQDIPGRVARLLLEQMESGGQTLSTGEILLTATRTHQQMAEQIGAARESVTRALGDLRRRKILRSEGRRLIIIDLKSLRLQVDRV